MSTRINRYLAETGVASRREADRLVAAGEVTIDGRVAVLGDTIEEGQEVFVRGERIGAKQAKVYLVFHKPIGVITTTDPNSRDNIMDALHKAGGKLPRARIFPVGRLDVASSGLILFTNDSDITDKLLRSAGRHEKEYFVEVDKPMSETAMKAMRVGLPILGRKTLPARLKPHGERSFFLTLVEGRNRQIRRMCTALGYEVRKLQRVRILNLHLGELKKGQWRPLSQAELDELKRIVLG
jgi:23S rRNA pseudouridine2604 synthase